MLFSSEFRHLTPCSPGLTILLPYLGHVLVGSLRPPGALLHCRSPNRYCCPLQKGTKSLRALSIQIMGKSWQKNSYWRHRKLKYLLGGGLSLPQTTLVGSWHPNGEGSGINLFGYIYEWIRWRHALEVHWGAFCYLRVAEAARESITTLSMLWVPLSTWSDFNLDTHHWDGRCSCLIRIPVFQGPNRIFTCF